MMGKGQQWVWAEPYCAIRIHFIMSSLVVFSGEPVENLYIMMSKTFGWNGLFGKYDTSNQLNKSYFIPEN